jgi:hypothetical protein
MKSIASVSFTEHCCAVEGDREIDHEPEAQNAAPSRQQYNQPLLLNQMAVQSDR